MKKSKLFSLATIFIIFSLIIPICIEAKLVPPGNDTQLTPEHVADKIVTHGYSLIDAYIKELPGFTSTFPNGKFYFTLDNDVQIDISPAGINRKVWRTIGFGYPDGSVLVIVLDGPVYGEPGTPNTETIAGAKETLATELLNSNMLIKKINRSDVNLNLASIYDFQIFIDLMFNSIKISTPLFTGPEPTEATLPKGTLVKINPTDEKPIEIAGTPSSVREVKTKVDFIEEEKEVKINVDKPKRESKISIDNTVVTTNKTIEIKESKLYVETSIGLKEIKVLPEEASSKATEITTVKEIEIKEESKKVIYSIKGTRRAKLLFVIPITLDIETKVSAENSQIVSVKKPWWSFLAW